MTKQKNALIIEQEPLISFSIEEALRRVAELNQGISFKPKCLNSYKLACDEVISKKQFDLVFISIDIESKDHEKLQYIKDMMKLFKASNDHVQFLMLTSHQDNYMIAHTIKTLDPDAVLLKKDVSFNDLLKAIESVINSVPFYSKSVLRMLRSRITSDIPLDQRDRLILHHLSKGVRTKDLSELVHLSNSGIESRKRNLKRLFDVEQKNDRFLLEQARIKGFI
ncbi:hypothetical protein [uncultured Psychroserpens sp.]|uniref:hypothetical protein n=1 Tax=uncultured Psychroserpens sp. TaxID=255436 RepID=UPI0026320885|nr:hypothetical protein [uncultured Psychroserpens sp.]